MDESDFRQLVLDLAGPHRDRAHLARLLGITEATAYGWIRMAESGELAATTAVRGDANRKAKEALLEAAERLERGTLGRDDVEDFLRERLGTERATGAPAQPTAPEPGEGVAARASLQRGLRYVLGRLEEMSLGEAIAALEAILAMLKEDVKRMKD
jgi:hypothetical protein